MIDPGPMKKSVLHLVLFAFVLSCDLSSGLSSAYAKDKAHKTHTTTTTTSPTGETVTVTHSAPERSTTISGNHNYGLGLQTFGNLANSSTALSAWINLVDVHSVQLVATIGSTSPFNFGVGGLYRYQMFGTRSAGFHLGSGIALGSKSYAGAKTVGSKFFTDLSALSGFHFMIPETSNIQVNLDAAATLEIVDGDSNFMVGGLSPALGLGVHYFF